MAIAPTVIRSSTQLYEEHVNPQWVRLLELLRMNVSYRTCVGTELFTTDGDVYLDYLSGYCVYNAGHNHPRIVQAIKDELDKSGPSMLQSHIPELAGELAARLCRSAGGRVTRAFFASSGSEGVEAAIKFSRATTKRDGILYAENGFHGLTCGALSLMSNDFWREGFGPLLQDTLAVPFGSIEELEKQLKTKKFASFITEPIQSEAGINLATREYMQKAQELCRRYGTLFVLDEVQTGMYRTGPFLAAHHCGVEPDMVIMAKAMSAGLIPVAAVLMTDEICDSVYTSLNKAFIHTSTYSENGLALRAALTTLDVLEDENLGAECTRKGEYLRTKLRERLSRHDMFKEVRGEGLLNGIEFKAPTSMAMKMSFAAFKTISPAMFGQMLVMRLFRNEKILTQICGNNFMVLKVAPPLVVTEAQMDRFVDAIDKVLEEIHGSGAFWTEALGLARRAAKI
jgi:ornithine--oxo-acid transaminase